MIDRHQIFTADVRSFVNIPWKAHAVWAWFSEEAEREVPNFKFTSRFAAEDMADVNPAMRRLESVWVIAPRPRRHAFFAMRMMPTVVAVRAFVEAIPEIEERPADFEVVRPAFDAFARVWRECNREDVIAPFHQWALKGEETDGI
jgi:hypothetical protein